MFADCIDAGRLEPHTLYVIKRNSVSLQPQQLVVTVNLGCRGNRTWKRFLRCTSSPPSSSVAAPRRPRRSQELSEHVQ